MKIFKRIKNYSSIFKILGPFILGVISSFYDLLGQLFPYNVVVLTLLLLTLILILPRLIRQFKITKLFGYVIMLLFFFIGGLSVKNNSSEKQETYFYKNGKQYYQIRVNEPPTIKPNSVKILVDVLSRNDTSTVGKSLIYFAKDSNALKLEYGDVLIVKMAFTKTKANGNPLEFNYPKYLKLFDIYHQGYLNTGSWLKIDESKNRVFDITYRISFYLSNLIDKSNLKNENKAIAKALLLGQKDDLDKEVLRTYSSAGAMHVLAVSGLHVGIIMMILMFILKPLKRFKSGQKIFVISVLFGVWFYAFVTGLSPSVLRSSLMFSFIVIGKELERETSVYQSILVSAFILILIDPLVVFKVGFQLSYLAVLGIVYIQPKIYNLFYIKFKPLDYLWQISSVSVAAQIATFPLGLYYFHQFPNFFLISNLIVIPLAGFILGVGLIYFLAHYVPCLGDLMLNELNGLLSLMNDTVGWVKGLPYSITWGISIIWYEVFLIYVILGCLIFSFSLKKAKLFIISFVLLVLLLGIFSIRSANNKRVNQFVLYNIKNHLAIDVFYGDKNVFISSQSLLSDENTLLFNVKHYWYRKTGQELPIKWVSSESLKDSILKLNTKTVSVLSKEFNRNFKTNIVIISDVEYVPQQLLDDWESKGTYLVLHQKIKYGVKKNILIRYPKLLVFDMKEKGAFTFFF